MGPGRTIVILIATLVGSACDFGTNGAPSATDPLLPTTTSPTRPGPDTSRPPPPTGPPIEPSRVVVVPDSIDVSADRKTVTARTSFPAVGHCEKIADGIEVVMDNGVAIVTAWLRSDTPAEGMCTLECGAVTQSITLPEPLPDGIVIASPDGAYPGCQSGPGIPTTTVA